VPESQSRRLAAILAADIAGYSALMGSDEARTVRDLKGRRASKARHSCARRCGWERAFAEFHVPSGIGGSCSRVLHVGPAPSLPASSALVCAQEPPSGGLWLHEVKHDGRRRRRFWLRSARQIPCKFVSKGKIPCSNGTGNFCSHNREFSSKNREFRAGKLENRAFRFPRCPAERTRSPGELIEPRRQGDGNRSSNEPSQRFWWGRIF
jgi:hypothetical protein